MEVYHRNTLERYLLSLIIYPPPQVDLQLTTIEENDIYRIYNNKQFIGIGIVENKLLKRDIVI